MDIITRLNWVDVLVIILIIRTSYVAFQEGLSHEFFPVIGGISILVLTLSYYKALGLSLSKNLFNLPVETADFLVFLALTLGVGFIFRLLKVLTDKLIKVELHPFIEKVGGAIVGIFRATLVTTLVLMVIALAPLPYLQRSVREKSLTGMYFLKFGVDVYEKASLALPMLKREGKVFAKERILEDLSKDKSIVQASGEEKPQRKKGSDDLP